MGRKLRHFLIFLLIILKEPNMPEGKIRATITTLSATALDKPESDSSQESTLSFATPVSIGCVIGAVPGILMICTVVLMYKRRAKYPPVGQNSSNVTGSNSDTAVSVNTSGHDHQNDNVDNCHDQTGRGQSQSNYHPLKVEHLSEAEVLSALRANPMYEGLRSQPMGPIAVDSHIGRGSDNDQTGQSPSPTIAESHINPAVAIMTSGHYQGQPQAISGGLNARNVSYGTDPKAAIMTSGHYQMGRGQSQANPEDLNAENVSYGAGPTASVLNSLYDKHN
ncbi:RAM signaling network component [Branchiostoma belcheri]|nr:RAM signaling network component [Branchiostoma belcheri]